MTKTCTQCKKTKPVADFHIDRKNGGARSKCKGCRSLNLRKWRAERRPPGVRVKKEKDVGGTRWESHIRRRYGIDSDVYHQMLFLQKGKCAICGVSVTTMKTILCVDHDHDTGAVRELLCSNCNRMLGFGQDDPKILMAGAKYLAKHKKKNK